MYDDIEKLIEVSAHNECYVDENDEFQTRYAVDKVNEYLGKGWKLLSINYSINDDHTSYVNSYILGFPKSNSSK